MNPIHAKLKIYTYSLTALTAICTVLRVLCLLFAYDTDLRYFSLESPLPTIADGVLLCSLLWAATALIFIPRGTLRPLLPAYSAASSFATALCGFIFLFFAAADIISFANGGFIPVSFETYRRDLILFILSIVSSLLSAAYFFTALIPSRLSAGWRILFGFFPVIWAISTLADIYFDFTHAMNEPSKISIQLALIAIMFFLLQELRMLLGRHQPRIAWFFTTCSVLLCGVGGIAGAIAYAAMPEALADYSSTFFAISALWLYMLFRLFDLLRAQLSPKCKSDESETAV